MVSTFSRANNAALRQGFVADMKTYLVVAGENDALKCDPRNINLIFYDRNLVSDLLLWKFLGEHSQWSFGRYLWICYNIYSVSFSLHS